MRSKAGLRRPEALSNPCLKMLFRYSRKTPFTIPNPDWIM